MLNVESLPLLARAVQVKKVPSIFILNQGTSVERIDGNLNEIKLEKVITSLRLISGVRTADDIIVAKMNQAHQLLTQKSFAESIQSYKNIINSEIFHEKYELTCWVAIGRAYYEIGDIPNAEIFVKRLSSKYSNEIRNNPQVRNIVDTIYAAIDSQFYKVNLGEYNIMVSGLQEEISIDP